uniref:SRPBCC ligand-binding domain superfamily protein n=1 Tax=uncultured bacterium CSL11 TaxID=1091566 RepID=G4WVD6_9BACT|nr:SRPBCC ligand-binding domain superfamily protein [uncultured bacterium CSL11]
MTKIVKSVYIEAPAEKIYDYLIEPANLPEYWPNVVKVSDVKPLPNGGYSTSWIYKTGFLKFKGTGVTVDCARNQFIIDHIKGGVDSTQKWTLSPKGHGTVATFEVEYSIPIPVIGGLLGKILEIFSQRDGEKVMALLKSKMEL